MSTAETAPPAELIDFREFDKDNDTPIWARIRRDEYLEKGECHKCRSPATGEFYDDDAHGYGYPLCNECWDSKQELEEWRQSRREENRARSQKPVRRSVAAQERLKDVPDTETASNGSGKPLFLQIDLDLAPRKDLTSNAKLVYGYLKYIERLSKLPGGSGIVQPSQATIAEALGIGQASVSAAVNLLESKKLIRRTFNGMNRPLRYEIQ